MYWESQSQLMYVLKIDVNIVSMASLTDWIIMVIYCRNCLNQTKYHERIILMFEHHHKHRTTQHVEVFKIFGDSKYLLRYFLETDRSNKKRKWSYDPTIQVERI